MRRLGLLAFGLCAGLSSCSSGESGEPVGTVRQAIIGGGESGAAHDGAVLLVFEGPSGETLFACTAALVAPNLIVTARHCVSEVEDANVGCDETGRQVSGGEVGQDRPAKRFAVHVGARRPAAGTAAAAHGKTIKHDGAKTLCGHDVAYLVLDTAIPNAPILPMRIDAPVKKGESLIAVGYGITKTEAEPAVRQERRGVVVQEVGPFEGDADEPPVAPRDFLVGESFCQGDSGGPALSEASGAVVGIATRVTNGNTSPNKPWDPCVAGPVYAFYTQLGMFRALSDSAFAAAGAKAWFEGGRDPRLPPEDEGCQVSTTKDAPSSFFALLFGLVVTGIARGRWPARTGKRR